MADLPTVPDGFGCLLMDPPWRMAMWSEKGMGRSPDGLVSRNEQRQNNPERHYATMSLGDLQALPVPDVAAKDSVLLMWAIDPLLPEAIALGTYWGWRYKTVGFYWVKRRRVTSKRGRSMLHPDHREFPMSTGYWTRANPEPCLLFTRGKPKRLSAGVRKLIVAPRREHSRKPDEQYERIEALCEGPRLEMFARQSRERWTSWGNEVDKFIAPTPLFDPGAAAQPNCHVSAAPPGSGEMDQARGTVRENL